MAWTILIKNDGTCSHTGDCFHSGFLNAEGKSAKSIFLMLRWESASVLAFFLMVKVMCALYRICLHIIFIFPSCAVAILDIYPSFHFLHVCVGFLTKLLRLTLTSLHPPLSCFSSARVFSSFVCITIHFLCLCPHNGRCWLVVLSELSLYL